MKGPGQDGVGEGGSEREGGTEIRGDTGPALCKFTFALGGREINSNPVGLDLQPRHFSQLACALPTEGAEYRDLVSNDGGNTKPDARQGGSREIDK